MKHWTKETIKRLKKKQPKYFQKWFWVYIFTAVAGAATTVTEVASIFPEVAFITMLGKILMAVGVVGGFMSRLPNLPEPEPEKKD